MNKLTNQSKDNKTGKFQPKMEKQNQANINNDELNNNTVPDTNIINDNTDAYITSIKQLLYSGWYEKEEVEKAYRLIVNNPNAIATVLVMRRAILNYK